MIMLNLLLKPSRSLPLQLKRPLKIFRVSIQKWADISLQMTLLK